MSEIKVAVSFDVLVTSAGYQDRFLTVEPHYLIVRPDGLIAGADSRAEAAECLALLFPRFGDTRDVDTVLDDAERTAESWGTFRDSTADNIVHAVRLRRDRIRAALIAAVAEAEAQPTIRADAVAKARALAADLTNDERAFLRHALETCNTQNAELQRRGLRDGFAVQVPVPAWL